MKETAFSAPLGTGSVKELAISNPTDYPSGDAISLGTITFKYQQSSFWEDRTVVNELRLENGMIHYQEVNGVSNISTILASIQTYSEKNPSSRIMVIDRLIISGWKCSAKFSPDDSRPTEFNIPDVEIVGLKGTGAQVGQQISVEIATQIRKRLQAPGTLFRRGKNALLSTMDSIGRGSKGLVMDFIGTLTGKPPTDGPDDAPQSSDVEK